MPERITEPGKFEGELPLTPRLWDLSLEGGQDDSIGDVQELGWYAKFNDENAILSEDSNGFVSSEQFESREDLDAAWSRIEQEYDRFYGEAVPEFRKGGIIGKVRRMPKHLLSRIPLDEGGTTAHRWERDDRSWESKSDALDAAIARHEMTGVDIRPVEVGERWSFEYWTGPPGTSRTIQAQEGAITADVDEDGIPAIIHPDEAVIPLTDPDAVDVMAEAIEEGTGENLSDDDDSAEAVAEAAEAVAEAAEEVAESAAEVASAAVDIVEEHVDALEAIADFAEEVTDDATEMAEQTTDVAEVAIEASEEATEEASEVAQSRVDTAPRSRHWSQRSWKDILSR